VTTIELTWAAACAGSSVIPAERGAIPMTALRQGVDVPGSRGARVRHVAWQQRKQGRSVFTGTNPISYPAQANLRLVVTNDDKVWGPHPWRPPPV
jgi:hypothetical protein